MAKKINYDNWSKEELIKELRRIKETKYGLVWHRDLPEEKIDVLINPDAKTPSELFSNEMAGKPFPVLKENKANEIIKDENNPYNIIIEGDNYHSLAVLNFTHQEEVDLIYIDPPYNTGNRDFAYNDDYVDKENRFRHSKWLSFIAKRLKLAKYLLKDTGIIAISIDDNEIGQLRVLMDDPNFFGESNFIAMLPTIMNLKGNNDQFGFAGTHEYTLIYAKNKSLAKINEFDVDEEEIMEKWSEDEYSFYKKGANLKATGTNAPREKRPNLFYPIFFKPNGDFYTTKNDKPLNKKDKIILPITDNKEMSWRWSKEKLNNENYNVIISLNGEYSLYKKQRPQLGDLPTKKPKTLFYKPEYSSGNGTTQLKEMFGDKVFDNPKPLHLIKDILYLTSGKDSTILDFMAGSGTTGVATLLLNEEDQGNRKFILCTNNENNICTDVCYPRIKKVITGYESLKREKIKGLSGNLKYFTAYDFVESEPTDRNKRKLVKKSTEMLCIKENAFELVQDEAEFKIYKNNEKYLGIIFYEEAIEDFKKSIKKIKGDFNVYVFSVGDEPNDKEFSDVMDKVKLCAIPEVILKVYREIFKINK